MKRLIQENINSPEEYDKIYLQRSQKPVDRQDMKRWKRLLKYYRGGDLIDLGCLDSNIIELLKDKSKYFGVDFSMKSIESMNKKYNTDNFIFGNIYDLRMLNEEFEYAILGEVIEHLEKPEYAIKEAMRVLKKGGILALSTPLEEEQEIGAVDKERHVWSFSVGDIINMLKPYGSVKTKLLGSEYYPKYVYHWPSILAYCHKK